MGALEFGLKAALCNLCTIVYNCGLLFCGPFGPLSKGNSRHKMTTIVGNRGQLWTIVDKYLKPPFAQPLFRLSQAKGMDLSGKRVQKCSATPHSVAATRGQIEMRHLLLLARKKVRPILRV